MIWEFLQLQRFFEISLLSVRITCILFHITDETASLNLFGEKQ